jgi:hypothetical protein
MTGEHRLIEHIGEARQSLAAASEQWNAVDLSAIEGCISVLESSAASLTAAFEILQGAPQRPCGSLRAALIGIKEDATRLQRLVDAAAAFLREVPGAGWADVELYQPGGTTRAIRFGSEPWGMQG